MKTITLSKQEDTISGSVRLPSSKSISNRLLVIRALCHVPFEISNLSEADDTILLLKLLADIPSAGANPDVVELDTGNAGTVMRFLTAMLSNRRGKWMLTGSDRMKQRPIGELVDALVSLGAVIDYLGKPGFPPLLIKGGGLHGGEVSVDAGVSSQFISALLLIAPFLPGGLRIRLKGEAVSFPYVKMTIGLMEFFGIAIKQTPDMVIVKQGCYQPHPYIVPPDWSSAAYWYEAVAMAGKADLMLPGLTLDCLQGDAILPEIYRNFGVISDFSDVGARLTKTPVSLDSFYFDFSNYPDIAQAVIATCAGIRARGRFEGLKSLRIKETDRIRAIQGEIEKLGFESDIWSYGDAMAALEIRPVKPMNLIYASFETYGDHRMAMTLAPFALKIGTVCIQNPDVVVKSYPHYWEQLKMTGFQIR